MGVGGGRVVGRNYEKQYIHIHLYVEQVLALKGLKHRPCQIKGVQGFLLVCVESATDVMLMINSQHIHWAALFLPKLGPVL